MHSYIYRTAIEIMQKEFQKYNHEPSWQQMEALNDILETLSLMAYGKAEPKYYLSSLDPGVGKSTAIGAWIKALLHIQEPQLDHIGVLLCVERLDEIEQFLRSMDLDEEHYAVVAQAGHELNNSGLSSERVAKARILLTTPGRARRSSAVSAFILAHDWKACFCTF